MALDYSPKRQVNKNRPRRRPLKLIFVALLGTVIGTFGLGVATGWLLFHKSSQIPAAMTASAQGKTVATSQAQPPGGSTQTQQSGSKPPTEPDLTFYYTLPKGENAVMGSGINPSAEKIGTAKPATPVESATKPTTFTNASKQSATSKVSADTTSYSVQIAAYKSRKDADSLKTQFAENGFSTRIEEYSVPGKGTWYRVRVGHSMERNVAEKLATKLGGEALAVPE